MFQRSIGTGLFTKTFQIDGKIWNIQQSLFNKIRFFSSYENRNMFDSFVTIEASILCSVQLRYTENSKGGP